MEASRLVPAKAARKQIQKNQAWRASSDTETQNHLELKLVVEGSGSEGGRLPCSERKEQNTKADISGWCTES